jgi:hypothetical protein
MVSNIATGTKCFVVHTSSIHPSIHPSMVHDALEVLVHILQAGTVLTGIGFGVRVLSICTLPGDFECYAM